MKAYVHTRAVGRLALTCGIMVATIGTGLSQQTDIPRGTLSVDRDLVRVGTRSNLDWNIEYPAAIKDIVDVDPTGTIKPKKTLRMRVPHPGSGFPIRMDAPAARCLLVAEQRFLGKFLLRHRQRRQPLIRPDQQKGEEKRHHRLRRTRMGRQ